MKSLENRIAQIIPFALVALGLVFVGVLLYTTSESTRERQLEGQTYARFVACSLSFPPGTRTTKDIDFCWKEASKDTGKSVKRYGNLNR